MHSTIALPVLLWVSLLFMPAAARAQDKDKPAAPDSEYQSMVKEFSAAREEFFKSMKGAKDEEERAKLAEKSPERAFSKRFLEFADKHSKDGAGFDALAWIVQNDPYGAASIQVLKVIGRDHLQNKKLAGLLGNLQNSPYPEAAELLRAVMEKSPEKETQARACVTLANYYKSQAEAMHYFRQLKDEAEIKRLEKMLDKAVLKIFRERDPSAATASAETYFEKAATAYGDVSLGRGTIGENAKTELFEIRNLSVGKTAPAIEGADVDDVKFKLSDYRGKVVVIDFWGDW